MLAALRLTAAFLLCLVLAPVAQAQTPGLHVDPDSPSGHEYAIPLDRARDEAAPGGGVPGNTPPSGSQPTGDSPLFGAGVGSGSGTGSSGASDGGDAKGGSQNGRQEDAPARSPLSKAAIASATATPSGGIQTSLMVMGGAALVLLIGTTLGVSLRRRNSSVARG